MKKRLATLLSLGLILCLLAGCVGTPVVYNCTEDHSTTAPVETLPDITTEPTESTTPATGALKTGLAIAGNISGSENAVQADYDVTVVAVMVDEAGVIRDCIIDGIATKTTIDATGAVTSDPTAPISTKNELGENYGMVAWGGAKYEWNVQADALAQYAVGKTVEELRAGAINEQGKAPEGSDLASTATIYLGGYVSAIETAVANAQVLGAQVGDSLKLAVLPSMEATGAANEGGNSTLTVDATALTEKNGVVTSCLIDSLQAKVEFDGTGTITTDLTAPLQTKNELGENYGMVAWGGAIAEWDAQAASFASYICGKTAEEISGIAVNEKTAPTEADLASSVTIAIGGFRALVQKALAQVNEEAPVTALKTGLAIVGNVSGSKNAEYVDYDVTVVALLVDEAGVIQDCIIDGIATKVNIDATGSVTSEIGEILTKNELGENYGMVAWGGAKYEWNVQADALAQYAVGKTAEELRNGAVNEQGKAPEGSDLASTATIYLGGYVSAIEKAVANAQDLGAQSGDTLKLGVLPAAEAGWVSEEGGDATLTVDATALTENNGVVTACLIDSLQAKVSFDATGTITTDITAPLQTKNELGENYGMVAWGGAMAEWNVQATSFASYICGKNGAEIEGIAVNEDTTPAEVDLASSVTIAIGDFQNLVLKALYA